MPSPHEAEAATDVSFRENPKSIDCWNLFLDRAGFEKLSGTYERPQDFFKTLESTDISDLLMEISVQVKVRNWTDQSLSRTKRGRTAVAAGTRLLRFTQEEEALFLLDEPDTHLNPQWSVRYLAFIESIVGKQPTSQILMATHDPLVFAGLRRGGEDHAAGFGTGRSSPSRPRRIHAEWVSTRSLRVSCSASSRARSADIGRSRPEAETASR